MKRPIIILIFFTMTLLLGACSKTAKKTVTMNPLLNEFSTPYGVPPFDKIQNDHFIPAFEEGMRLQKEKIEQIVNNNQTPSFQNTIEALEYSGERLTTISEIFFNLSAAKTDSAIQQIAKTVAPMLSKHEDEILLNEDLFHKVKVVYNKKEHLNLEKEQAKLLEETYKGFVRGGANLAPEKKEELIKINEELSVLGLQFGENLLNETNDFLLIIDNEKDLSGLPESVRAAAAEEAKTAGYEGKWVYTLQKPSWIPFLTYADNRLLREKLYKAMYNRGNNGNQQDNNQLISKLINLRLKKANIMDFENWSAFLLDDRMAKTPENVYDLLYKVWEPALQRAKEEAFSMQNLIRKEGGKFKLASWDWWYYTEKIRKEKYDLDEEQLRPYFELNNVRDGAFAVANKLFGLTFNEIEEIPVYHEECSVFKVTDSNGAHIGILYLDFFPRASKKGGAWMTSYRKQHHTNEGKNIRPVISIVCNFSKPTADKPALLSFEEVTTLFHEFGHALHGLLSQCRYYSLSGTAVLRDFVELPSQIMENWAPEPEVLKLFAKHYKTGEVIPQKLVDKLTAADKFNQGFATTEYLAASFLDMDYHTITEESEMNPALFEVESMKKIGLIDEIIPRYKSTYFAHIFSLGYSSGYYSYLWAEVLDADAFEAFKETNNIFDKAAATSFRKNILEQGGTEDPMKLYLNFRGKKPTTDPLLVRRGLKIKEGH